jgi:hypothetical protein
MAFAAFAAPAMAQSAMVGTGGVDILGQGIFETQGSAFKFPAAANTNYDGVTVGNDNAQAIGFGVTAQGGAFNDNTKQVTAQNNLKIKKNQDTGDGSTCASCSPKYNVEQIEVGSRTAQAIGFGDLQGGVFTHNAISVLAQNNVEIVTNQQ